MITAAVICEYNPFHNGHLYQIEYIKKTLKADRVICLMSGDFTQRGEPAVFEKSVRTKWALLSGADLVLCLPVLFSTGSAEIFAYGAVSILDRLNCVDYLCFGTETDDLNRLNELMFKIRDNAMIDNPEIQKLMRSGLTYAQARASVLKDYDDILSGSNNILAIEYLLSLRRLNSSVKPYIIKRKGSFYNDEDLDAENTYASATAIRKGIKENKETASFLPSFVYDDLKDLTPVYPNDLSDILKYKLTEESDLSNFYDVSSDLSLRIKNKLSSFESFDSFAETLKAKNFTRTRINRSLCHILLNINKDIDPYDIADNILYIRNLGFKKDSSDLLSLIKERSDINVISKIPDHENEFNDADRYVFDKDLFSFKIYDDILYRKSGVHAPSEYSKQIVVL